MLVIYDYSQFCKLSKRPGLASPAFPKMDCNQFHAGDILEIRGQEHHSPSRALDRDAAAFATLRAAELTGRPLGTADFVADLERRLGRPVARRAPGRKPKPPPPAQGRLF